MVQLQISGDMKRHQTVGAKQQEMTTKILKEIQQEAEYQINCKFQVNYYFKDQRSDRIIENFVKELEVIEANVIELRELVKGRCSGNEEDRA